MASEHRHNITPHGGWCVCTHDTRRYAEGLGWKGRTDKFLGENSRGREIHIGHDQDLRSTVSGIVLWNNIELKVATQSQACVLYSDGGEAVAGGKERPAQWRACWSRGHDVACTLLCLFMTLLVPPIVPPVVLHIVPHIVSCIVYHIVSCIVPHIVPQGPCRVSSRPPRCATPVVPHLRQGDHSARIFGSRSDAQRPPRANV